MLKGWVTFSYACIDHVFRAKDILAQPPLSSLFYQCAYRQWQDMGSGFWIPVPASSERSCLHLFDGDIFLRDISTNCGCRLYLCFWLPCLSPTTVVLFLFFFFFFWWCHTFSIKEYSGSWFVHSWRPWSCTFSYLTTRWGHWTPWTWFSSTKRLPVDMELQKLPEDPELGRCRYMTPTLGKKRASSFIQ